MPPKSSAAANTKDIRGFFAKPSKSTASKLSQSNAPVVEISDDDSNATTSKHFDASQSGIKSSRINTKEAPGGEKASNQPSTPATGQKRKKPSNVVLSSDSEAEAAPPKKKVLERAATGKTTNDNSSSKPPTAKRSQTGRSSKIDADAAAHSTKSEKNEHSKRDGEAAKENKVSKHTEVKNVETKRDTGNENLNPATNKPNYMAVAARRAAGPSQPGTKAIPDGEPNCLAGLTFVFTGELTSLGRDEAIDLAKRFGGRVTGQPSSKTSYVVVGEDAGLSKLSAIKKHKLPTLNEDEFLSLIATRKGFIDEKTKEKIEKEEAKIREAARELTKQEQKQKASGLSPLSQLWTTKYAPQTMKDICGNKSQVEKLQSWLHDWQASRKAGFKKPGKHAMGIFRAVLITGSPGIGKTTTAHLCAKLEGYTPIELNASDARSKQLVENATNINNTSLDGWMSGKKEALVTGTLISDKSVLIMDEVDGMSSGDRGGVGALNALIKKTKIPIICIANDAQAQKLKPLTYTCFQLPFKKPEAAAIRSRVLSICFKEGLEIPANVIDQLIQGAQSDIRQVITMLSTWRLSHKTMDFDQGKALVKMNEKYTLMTPWGIMNKILGPYSFSATSQETINDKTDLYFQDHSFVPMFMQENYLRPDPARAKQYDGPEKDMKRLEFFDKAASAISDGDLIDAMIHSSGQHWSLMPFHAIQSTVLPAYFTYGQMAHFGPSGISFPAWFGQNSKQSKLQRQLNDVQSHMRLRISSNKAEARMSYIPALNLRLVEPLVDSGTSAVDDVIECMDTYYLSKEDWEVIVELGVGDRRNEQVLKKISAGTKTSFTKKYNSLDHPVAFHKADDLSKAPKKLVAEQLPDLEEAFELDEPVEEEKEEKPSKDPTGISDDKLLKVGGRKGKAATKSKKAATNT